MSPLCSCEVCSHNSQPFANGRVLQFTPTVTQSARQPTRSKTSLLPRDSPLKERCTVVDTVPMATLGLVSGPPRARAEMILLIVGAREKNATCRWPLTVVCWELE